MRVYDRATQLLLHDWGGDEYRVTSMFFDGKYLYAGTSDGVLNVHDKQTLREVKSIYGYEDGAASNQVASNGSWLYSGGRKGSVRTWDMQTFKPGNDLEAGALCSS
jgi:WD40 repeat protein